MHMLSIVKSPSLLVENVRLGYNRYEELNHFFKRGHENIKA